MSTPSLTLLCCSREVSLPAQGDPPVRRQSSQRCLLFWAGERQQLRQWKGRASRLDILWGQHLLARSPRETLHVEGNQCFLPPNVFPYKPQVFFTAVTALQYMNPSPEAQSSGRQHSSGCLTCPILLTGAAQREGRAALQLVMTLYTFKCTSSQRPFPKAGSKYIYSGSN